METIVNSSSFMNLYNKKFPEGTEVANTSSAISEFDKTSSEFKSSIDGKKKFLITILIVGGVFISLFMINRIYQSNQKRKNDP